MKIRKKDLHTVFFILATVVCVIALFKFQDLARHPFYVMLSACFLYLIWALVYHKFDKSLTLNIYLEYLLTAALVLVLMTGVI